jgi:microcompartment protein CcmL/EutN
MDQKKCKRKVFEYLISQETVRERKIYKNYLKQRVIREIPRDIEDAIFKNQRKEKEDPVRFEDGVMVQEQHKAQPLAIDVSQCTMLSSLQEKLDYSKQERNTKEDRYHNSQVYKKEVYISS